MVYLFSEFPGQKQKEATVLITQACSVLNGYVEAWTSFEIEEKEFVVTEERGKFSNADKKQVSNHLIGLGGITTNRVKQMLTLSS